MPDRNEYLLTRYEDVVRAATTPQVFSNYMPASAGVDVDGKHFPFTRTAPKYHAPERAPIRSLAVLAFTASRVASHETMIVEYIEELFRSVEMTSTVEFISAVAQPLPEQDV